MTAKHICIYFLHGNREENREKPMSVDTPSIEMTETSRLLYIYYANDSDQKI